MRRQNNLLTYMISDLKISIALFDHSHCTQADFFKSADTLRTDRPIALDFQQLAVNNASEVINRDQGRFTFLTYLKGDLKIIIALSFQTDAREHTSIQGHIHVNVNQCQGPLKPQTDKTNQCSDRWASTSYTTNHSANNDRM